MTMVNLETLHLEKGDHKTREAGVCALEAVAWLAGEEHTDHPACACPVVSAFVRRINDRMPDDQRQRLVPYLPKLVGSRVTQDVEVRRAYVAADFAVRDAAVRALRSAGRTEDADKLAALPPIVDRATAEGARAVARTAAADTAADTAAAYAAAYAAAAYAADAAAYAAAAAAYAADAAAAAAAAYAAAAAAAYAADAAAAARLGAKAPSPGDRWAPALACLDRMLAVA